MENDVKIDTTEKSAIDELLKKAEVRAEEGDDLSFNGTDDDYTIVFGRSKSTTIA